MNSKKKSYSTDAVKIIVAAGALAGIAQPVEHVLQ